MKKIYCFPYNSINNKYIDNQKRIWEAAGFDVHDLLAFVTEVFLFNSWPQRKDICILNWFEDIPSNSRNSKMSFFKCILVLLFVRFFFREVVWVRHNLKPHSEVGVFYFNVICCLLGVFSNKIVAHRPISNNVFYVPHPLYEITKSKSFSDISCLIFGAVKKYKCIPELLEIWPSCVDLTIAGFCKDEVLRKNINDVIDKRGLCVTWIDEYLDDTSLNNLILRSRVVVFNHSDDSMIVSGGFYHAASCGSRVLLRSSDFGSFCENNYSFAKQYSSARSLEYFIFNSSVSRRDVILEAEEKNGSGELVKCWKSLLE